MSDLAVSPDLLAAGDSLASPLAPPSALGAPTGGALTPQSGGSGALPWEQAKPIIFKYESAGGQNIPNYMYDSTHTAQGQYQITNSTWRDWAPRIGVDLGQYPNAMSAPSDVQEQVAKYGYQTHGFAPWAPFNSKLASAVGWKGGLQPIGVPSQVGGAPPSAPSSDSLAISPQPASRALQGGDPSMAHSPWERLMLLSMIQRLTSQGTHTFQPIEYDPWKYVPQLVGGARLGSIGGQSV